MFRLNDAFNNLLLNFYKNLQVLYWIFRSDTMNLRKRKFSKGLYKEKGSSDEEGNDTIDSSSAGNNKR